MDTIPTPISNNDPQPIEARSGYSRSRMFAIVLLIAQLFLIVLSALLVTSGRGLLTLATSFLMTPVTLLGIILSIRLIVKVRESRLLGYALLVLFIAFYWYQYDIEHLLVAQWDNYYESRTRSY